MRKMISGKSLLLKTVGLLLILGIAALSAYNTLSNPNLEAEATDQSFITETRLSTLVFPRNSAEQEVVGLVNGSRAYDFDVQLENIALGHYAFRSGGSSGATEAANWIKGQFESFGLEAWLEPFEFTTWDLTSQPSMVIDGDGNPATTNDQTAVSSFQSEHLSCPTSLNGAFADLVVLPLPPAAGYSQLGMNPINTTAWDAIDTTGKILLIGREVRWGWQFSFQNKLTAQPPAAVVYTWWYDWMSFTPPLHSSSGGRYFWNLGIPAGFVDYEQGMWMRNQESAINVSARVEINSTISTGTHYNVVGKISGFTSPEETVIISGHYDTVMGSGFADNGAGTAGVVELAKVFADAVRDGYYRPAYTLLFVAFASEEFFLVGSTYYIKQHKSEMANITAVLNLDCIGSDEFRVSQTDPVGDFNLGQVIYEAAQDLGIPVNWEPSGGSDHESFRDPAWANSLLFSNWGVNLGISDAFPVASSALLISRPLLYSDLWNTGTPGWIHTSYDNSTSTATLNWVEVVDLENHIKIAALSVVRVSPDVPALPRNIALRSVVPGKTTVGLGYSMRINVTVENQGSFLEHTNITIYANASVMGTLSSIPLANSTSTVLVIALNTTGFAKGNYTISAVADAIPDETTTVDNIANFTGTVLVTIAGDVTSPTGSPEGTVNMRDIGAICYWFGSSRSSLNWDPVMDINDDDVVNMRDIGIACDNFGKT